MPEAAVLVERVVAEVPEEERVVAVEPVERVVLPETVPVERVVPEVEPVERTVLPETVPEERVVPVVDPVERVALEVPEVERVVEVPVDPVERVVVPVVVRVLSSWVVADRVAVEPEERVVDVPLVTLPVERVLEADPVERVVDPVERVVLF